ncbi:MAG: cell division protein FtsQ [Rubrivivax sp. SCN 71-131]|jgi:cell division protein FtsQ|nr:MAG: cell division protein FtsQ [Rubrivivax sp. SCN 71-131]
MSGLRLTRDAAPAVMPALPADVRLTQAVASLVFLLLAALLLAALLLWLARSPAFQLRGIRVEGALQRIDAGSLRTSVAPRVSGNFFSADLDAVRAAFESVPWVRRASVRRVWPDRLVVTIEEHQAAALWQADEREDRLVNRQGEVFAANVGDVEDEALPTFVGPEGSAAALLSMYRRLQPLVQTLQARVERLQLSARGSWRVLLDGGARLELGRGVEDEVLARTQRFVRTLPQVTERLRAPLEAADLRHTDGYAVRLRGVSTLQAAPAGAPPAR